MKQGFNTDITVVIPSIPPRLPVLTRCIESISAQTYPPDLISIAIDHARFGAAVTRNRALRGATTTWVAFIDDDDTMNTDHLKTLVDHQLETGADVVWSWFDVVGGTDPFPMHFGKQWNPDLPHSFPITTLVRRELAMDVGGFPEDYIAGPMCAGEDYPFWVALSKAGAKFSHIPVRTWKWWWNRKYPNTSGLASRW